MTITIVTFLKNLVEINLENIFCFKMEDGYFTKPIGTWLLPADWIDKEIRRSKQLPGAATSRIWSENGRERKSINCRKK